MAVVTGMSGGVRYVEAASNVGADLSPLFVTIVSCDASGVTLGAVLSQIQDGQERLVAHASRALSPAE